MRSRNTSPSRRPVIPSITCPAQSMLLPYSHCSPGSNSKGVCRARRLEVTMLGCPWFSARRLYCSLKKSYPNPAVWSSSCLVVMSDLSRRTGSPLSSKPSRTCTRPAPERIPLPARRSQGPAFAQL